MGKYSEKSKEYTKRYVAEHYDEIKVRLHKEPKGKQYYTDCANNAGMKLSQFIISSMDEKIERDHLSASEEGS